MNNVILLLRLLLLMLGAAEALGAFWFSGSLESGEISRIILGLFSMAGMLIVSGVQKIVANTLLFSVLSMLGFSLFLYAQSGVWQHASATVDGKIIVTITTIIYALIPILCVTASHNDYDHDD